MCLIRRRYEGWKRSQYYDLYLQFGGVNKYLITAHRKESGLHSIICLSIPHDPSSVEPLSNHTHEKDQLSIGSVKSNCANTTYYVTIDESVIQDLHNTQLIDMNELLVKYKLNRFSSWKPYEMKIYLKTPLCCTENSYPSMNVLSSKPPQWDPTMKTYVMDFRNRVTIPSIKNFQVEDGNNNVVLQFGRVGQNDFTMDFKYPLTLFQAYCIALTRFIL